MLHPFWVFHSPYTLIELQLTFLDILIMRLYSSQHYIENQRSGAHLVFIYIYNAFQLEGPFRNLLDLLFAAPVKKLFVFNLKIAPQPSFQAKSSWFSM